MSALKVILGNSHINKYGNDYTNKKTFLLNGKFISFLSSETVFIHQNSEITQNNKLDTKSELMFGKIRNIYLFD